MSIYKINSNLNTNDKIEALNDMILELQGLIDKAKFNKNDIDTLYDDLGSAYDRKYLRDQSLGHTLGTYTGWTHVQAETGYSIWKYSPTSYKYNSLNQLYLDDKIIENKGEADSETATAFDYVFFYDGATYTDDTTEAATETGTEFSLMADTGDYLYVGLSTTFAGAKFEFQTIGSGYTLVVQYYNGSWTTLTANTNDLADNTNSFESNGRITWTIPGDWSTVAVNSQTKYWIRISTSATPTTTAKAYYIIPGNSVISLLALSSTELLEETWAWCTYGTAVYVTIRNSGNSSYEGDYYITSSSSSTNKQNWFCYNHEITADYQDSTY